MPCKFMTYLVNIVAEEILQLNVFLFIPAVVMNGRQGIKHSGSEVQTIV